MERRLVSRNLESAGGSGEPSYLLSFNTLDKQPRLAENRVNRIEADVLPVGNEFRPKERDGARSLARLQ